MKKCYPVSLQYHDHMAEFYQQLFFFVVQTMDFSQDFLSEKRLESLKSNLKGHF